ncbi:MAG TPA: zinc ribbon domain-containing protein [Geobacteraceae bacterium]
MRCPHCNEELPDVTIACSHCGTPLNAPQPPQATASPRQPDFGALFTAALQTWKANLGDLVLLTLVFMVVVWIPIVNIGFIAGYNRALLKVHRGGKAQIGDLFSAWDCFGNLLVVSLGYFIAAVILAQVPLVGSLATLVLGFVAAPAALAIIDAGKPAIEACRWSIETLKEDLANWLMALIAGWLIGGAGIVLILVGLLFTIPLGQLIIIRQYEGHRP